jgi:Family of unknown function (DUF6502)
MSSAIQDRVISATGACLRPIARVLLRCGVSYRQFADMAKEAFIEEALSERDSRGRRANTSRVSVRTGISRKEVARLRDLEKGDARRAETRSVGLAHYSGHAARVLQVWHSDARFVGESGEPSNLPYSGENGSFVSLVKIAGGDVPPGAVKAELLAAGAVVELESGALKALKRHFQFLREWLAIPAASRKNLGYNDWPTQDAFCHRPCRYFGILRVRDVVTSFSRSMTGWFLTRQIERKRAGRL